MTSRPSSLVAFDSFMLLFALSAVLGVLPAYDPGLSMGALAAILLGVALYFAVAYLAHSAQSIRLIAVAGLITTAVLGLYFITQYDYQNYPETGSIIARLGQLTTLLPDLNGFSPFPNAVATFLEVAVPLGTALALSSRRTASRIALVMGTLIVTYAIFLTVSRGSWLALAATSGIAAALVILARLPRRLAMIAVGVGIVAVAVAAIAIILLGPERLPFLASTFSRATDRGRLYHNSLYLMGDYVFTGAGLGETFSMVYSRYGLLIQVPFLTYAHNLVLSIWRNQGLLGLVAFGGLVASFYLFVRRTYRHAQPSLVFHGAWLGVTATLLHGLTDATRYAGGNHWVMPMMFVWMGLTVASGRLALREATSDSPIRSRSISRPIAIGVVAAIVILGFVFNRPILAAWHTNLGAIAEARAELADGLTHDQRLDGYAAAAAEYQAALTIDPNQPNANRRLGNLWVNLDRFDEAVPLLEAAFEKESDNPAAIKGLGLAYTWVGQTEDAARMFHLLDDPVAMNEELYVWGNYRSEQDIPLLAAYAYETAQAMYPDSPVPDVWLLIGDAYRAAKHVDSARVWYNRVLEAEPDNERARQALQQLRP